MQQKAFESTSVQSTVVSSSTSSCLSYIGDDLVCIPNGLPTEDAEPGQGLGGCTWTTIWYFEVVYCETEKDGGSNGDGGFYDGSGIGDGSGDGFGGSSGGGTFMPGSTNPYADFTYSSDYDEIGMIYGFNVADEGADAVGYHEEYWSNPYLSFPSQPLPSFELFDSAYPKSSDNGAMAADKVFELIGGAVYSNALQLKWTNACAARVSRALNYSGITIPYIQGQTYQGGDGKYYFVGAANMFEWMKKTFGMPSISLNSIETGTTGDGFRNIVNGRKGIYFMFPNYPARFGASGHADIFDGIKFNKNGYFNLLGGLYSSNLWILN